MTIYPVNGKLIMKTRTVRSLEACGNLASRLKGYTALNWKAEGHHDSIRGKHNQFPLLLDSHLSFCSKIPFHS